MRQSLVGITTIATMIALAASGCESRSPAKIAAPATEAGTPGAPPDAAPMAAGETMTLVPTGERKTFTPDPATTPPRATPPDGTFRMVGIMLVTSIPDLEQRTSDVTGLASLIEGATAVVAEHDAARPGKLGAHAYVWIAIKPGRRVRAWLTGDEAVAAAIERPIVDAIGKLPGPEVRGLVVLVVPMARREEPAPEEFPQGPAAWQAAVRDGDTVEDAVARVWAD